MLTNINGSIIINIIIIREMWVNFGVSLLLFQAQHLPRKGINIQRRQHLIGLSDVGHAQPVTRVTSSSIVGGDDLHFDWLLKEKRQKNDNK